MIANAQSAGLAINLIEAGYAHYYSQGFGLEQRLQSLERNNRPGSEIHSQIVYTDGVFPKSIDTIILKALNSKEDLSKNLFSAIERICGG